MPPSVLMLVLQCVTVSLGVVVWWIVRRLVKQVEQLAESVSQVNVSLAKVEQRVTHLEVDSHSVKRELGQMRQQLVDVDKQVALLVADRG